MEGFGLIILIILAVIFVIFATAKLKLHPFLSLLFAALILGIVSGIPLPEVIEAVNGGFGGLMSGIGLVIIFGTIIGVILEKSGAALRMAEVVLRIVGQKRPQMAMSLIGAKTFIHFILHFLNRSEAYNQEFSFHPSYQ